MSLWTSDAAIAATLGEARKGFAVSGLSIDTRTIQPGDLFVALKGDARDGHDFVGAALAAKAGGALVSRRPDGVGADAPLLKVANTLRGLEDLARAARARSNAKVVAVTGSAGKTTTKEMLRLCFDALGRTHASAASYNNHWGVPLSLAGLPQDSQFGVFEVGMNHAGEIRALVALVRPHVALITTDEALGIYGAVDCGAYVANFMLAATALGVATIAQAALASRPQRVRDFFSLTPDRRVVCGISLGFEDPAHPANGFRTRRAELPAVVDWLD